MTCDHARAPHRAPPAPRLRAIAPRRRALAPRALAAACAAAMLAACDPASMPITGQRAEAQDIARQLVAARDPVIDPEPVARCAATYATPEQADALVAASRAGDRAAADAALQVMLRKTTTQACLAEAGQPDFL
jgi:hypothetical protein